MRYLILALFLSGCMTTTHTVTTTEYDDWTDSKTTWVESYTEPTDEAKVLTVGGLMLGALAIFAAFGGGEGE